MTTSAVVHIAPLTSSPDTITALSDLIVEVVAGGASVSFMHPLDPALARSFWTRSLAAADAGERAVLGAFDGDRLVGTVTLLLDLPPNQPHRAEIAKMMTHPSHRGRGIATALMREAERLARLHHRTLLTHDTAEEDGAGPFYERLGFIRCGLIPDFALKPFGGLTGTSLYYKRL